VQELRWLGGLALVLVIQVWTRCSSGLTGTVPAALPDPKSGDTVRSGPHASVSDAMCTACQDALKYDGIKPQSAQRSACSAAEQTHTRLGVMPEVECDAGTLSRPAPDRVLACGMFRSSGYAQWMS
jgi:hypothetical protein